MLVLIEALMVLITAFVALKTINLIFKPKKADYNGQKMGGRIWHFMPCARPERVRSKAVNFLEELRNP